MSFWSETSDLKLEPLRQYSWSIEILLSDVTVTQEYRPDIENIIKYSLKECSKPEYEISVYEHRLVTQYFKFPGQLKWKPITIKFVSTVEQKTSLETILEIQNKRAGYRTPLHTESNTRTPQHQQISKNNLPDVNLIQYDPDGKEIERWLLQNCLITSVNYGKLSYSSEDFVEISMTISYDWALQQEVDYYNKEEDSKEISDLTSQEATTAPSIPKQNVEELGLLDILNKQNNNLTQTNKGGKLFKGRQANIEYGVAPAKLDSELPDISIGEKSKSTTEVKLGIEKTDAQLPDAKKIEISRDNVEYTEPSEQEQGREEISFESSKQPSIEYDKPFMISRDIIRSTQEKISGETESQSMGRAVKTYEEVYKQIYPTGGREAVDKYFAEQWKSVPEEQKRKNAVGFAPVP